MPARGLGNAYHGMKWLRGSTRWAIYYRDRDAATGEFRCVWCRKRVWCSGDPDCIRRICVDHLVAVSCGGTNRAHNLVTSCMSCNNRRRHLSVREWIASEGLGADVVRAIRRVRRRGLTAAERAKGRALYAARPRYGKRAIPPHWSFTGAPSAAPPPTDTSGDDGTMGAPDVPF